ncbi:MAG: tyrosine-type recombinase/integrase [Rikenellaceae bacterium]
MNIKRNITFQLESRKKAGVAIVENVPIRMRVVFSGKRIDFTTGYRIDVAKWDDKKQRVKNGTTNKLKQSAAEINADLSKYENDIQEIFKRFEVAEAMPTTEQVREAFTVKTKPAKANEMKKEETPDAPDFWKIIDEFTKEQGTMSDWTHSTYEKFAAVKNHLQTFNKDLTFEYFDEFGLNNYVIFLRDVKQMRNSTIGKQLGFLKWLLRWGVKKGYTKNRAYELFKPKLKTADKKVIFLTWEEVMHIREFEIPSTKQYLERVRDTFLFQCYTGLRYSDLFNLRRSNIKENHIEFTTIKTTDSLRIELNKYSREVLEKYKDVAFEGDKALPVITNQKNNDYIKELAKLAGIDEPIHEVHYMGNERIETVTPKYALLGTHTGRRSFICHALSIGIPVDVVMKWTGHSDYKAMKPYIDIADKIKASQMSKFDQF